MGWRRASRYYAIRIKRLPGTPYSIACGFACGASVSFTPFIGFHFILAALLAWALRGNVIASAIGTAVGNPWTFPFIWAGVYWLGTTILGYERGEELPAELTIGVIFEEPQTILIPMVVGGVPASLVVWIIFFIPLRRLIANYQHHRRVRRIKRQHDLAEARRVREDGIANSNAQDPDGHGSPHGAMDELSIPEPLPVELSSDEVSDEPIATVTDINRALRDRGGG